ncbi:isoprenylcysteine carboxylmethyltransferase family protein [Candidatus Kaiserbacteria bacterium]|nr:isoprenylcysteine carboxylmethyltransferase family protein [Candidatus Kaiserbacteria bacterium]
MSAERQFAKIVTHPFFTLVTTLGLALLYTYFLYNHITAIKQHNVTPIIAIFVAMESVVLVLLAIRQQPVAKHTNVRGWLFAFLGTFMPFALFPFGAIVLHAPLGDTLTVIGGLIAVGAYLSLNTSFGVSPSLRTVKTNGLYRVVRHPMYAAYFFLYGGYLLLVFSPYNAFILCLLFVCLVMRIYYEEQILSTSVEYHAYKKTVPYRLFPFLY